MTSNRAGVSGSSDDAHAADNGNPSEAIAIMQGTYSWEKDPESAPTLCDITLSVPKGALCIVVGMVGSGKSSLLAAILGEMHCVRGTSAVNGSIAYTSQVCTALPHSSHGKAAALCERQGIEGF
jgi:ABC-type transport system involved in cytochrome bd biosynthesis fused ATPase/permease subunit